MDFFRDFRDHKFSLSKHNFIHYVHVLQTCTLFGQTFSLIWFPLSKIMSVFHLSWSAGNKHLIWILTSDV